MNKKINITIIVALLIISIFIGSNYFSLFQKAPVGMVQFAGSYDWEISEAQEERFRAEGIWPTAASTSIIGDFKLQTSIQDRMTETVYAPERCKTLEEMPAHLSYTEKEIDEDGCQIWDYTIRTYYCTGSYGSWDSMGELRGSDCVVSIGCWYSGCWCQRGFSQQGDGCHRPALQSSRAATFGGTFRPVISSYYGWGPCYSRHNLYYKDSLIWESDWSRNIQWHINEDTFDGTKGVWHFESDEQKMEIIENMNFYMDLSISRKTAPNQFYHCASRGYVQSDIRWIIPTNAFTVDIEYPNEVVQFGDDVTVKVTINNNWEQAVMGDLILNWEVPTILSQNSVQEDSEVVEIKQGESVFEYTMAATQVTDELKVQVELHVIIPSNMFEGVNGICYKQEDPHITDLSSCEYVEIGNVIENQLTINIMTAADIMVQLNEKDLSLEQQQNLIAGLQISDEEKAKLISDLEISSEGKDKLIEELNLQNAQLEDNYLRNVILIVSAFGITIIGLLWFIFRRK